jgi:hypothetical protein
VIVVTVMIVVIPIMIMVPAVSILVPPLRALFPAALPYLAQFIAPVLCLPAVVSVVLDGFVELVVRLGGAPLAIVIVGGGARHTYEQEHGSHRGSGQ